MTTTEEENDATQKRPVELALRDGRWMVEQSSIQQFSEWIVDLTMRGGDPVIDGMQQFANPCGPCAHRTIDRWHAVAHLVRLYGVCSIVTSEIQDLKAKIEERNR